jgi:hypothetical protein
MPQLTRIIYISRSTFKSVKSSNAIEPNVARILAKSRINNRRNGLVGVLYFGQGCFLQCLEGEQSAVDTLYAKLQLDDRHTDIKLLSRESIDAVSYTDWAMKFVPVEKQMMQLLQEGGYSSFDPYRFDAVMLQKVMHLLRASTDPTTDAVVESSMQESTDQPVVAKSSGLIWIIVVAVIAVAIVAGIFLLR